MTAWTRQRGNVGVYVIGSKCYVNDRQNYEVTQRIRLRIWYFETRVYCGRRVYTQERISLLKWKRVDVDSESD